MQCRTDGTRNMKPKGNAIPQYINVLQAPVASMGSPLAHRIVLLRQALQDWCRLCDHPFQFGLGPVTLKVSKVALPMDLYMYRSMDLPK